MEMRWALTSACEWDGDWDGDKDGMESCLGWCLYVLALMSLPLSSQGQVGSSFRTYGKDGEISVPPLPLVGQLT